MEGNDKLTPFSKWPWQRATEIQAISTTFLAMTGAI
jgi:hypothetical protein